MSALCVDVTSSPTVNARLSRKLASTLVLQMLLSVKDIPTYKTDHRHPRSDSLKKAESKTVDKPYVCNMQ